MSTDDLAWTIEDACRNAWPSPRQVLLGNHLLCAMGGPSRRANSVHPLRYGPRDVAAIIGSVEAIYRGLGQDSIVRIPSIVADLDEALDGLGYVTEGETCTLLADLSSWPGTDVDTADLTSAAEGDWFAARAALNSASAAEQVIYRTIVDSIILPKAFAACRSDGAIVAIAYGAIHAGLLVLESVATHPECRRRGFGRRIVAGLMDWAKQRGATGACLQVAADNQAATALYYGAGFQTEVYRYHYRRKALLGSAGMIGLR